MHGWRRNTEVDLHLGLRRGAPVNLGVVVNECQVLPLFLCIARHRSFLRARPCSVIIHPLGMLHSIAHKDHRGSPNLFFFEVTMIVLSRSRNWSCSPSGRARTLLIARAYIRSRAS